MYIKVVLFSSSFSWEGITYFIPSFLQTQIETGKIVIVPYGKQKKEALVLEILKENDFKKEKIKEIIEIKNLPKLLENYQIELIKFISKKYFSLIHHSVNLFFPKNLKEKIKKNKIFSDSTSPLTPLLQEMGRKTKKEEKNNKPLKRARGGGLSPKQQKVFEKIINSKNNKILFHGITGSGKTEIYIEIIKKNLKENKQTLILVPEIILTSQIFERIEKKFPSQVILINSTISEAKKTKNWLDIYNKNTKIIVGTRSAIFYPYKDLGTIIIDEEHDNSYISDKNPRYSAINIALKISELLNIKVILASGTPKINHTYKALKNEFELISLMEKFKK